MVELQGVGRPGVRGVVLHELPGARVPHAEGLVEAGGGDAVAAV